MAGSLSAYTTYYLALCRLQTVPNIKRFTMYTSYTFGSLIV